jgi:hypothetical protein
LLEDVAAMENLDAILAVPGIDLYSIGPNDFAQSLGYPGQLDHPEVVKAKQEITQRIHQAGGRMQADVMQSAGVSDMLLEGGGVFWKRNSAKGLRYHPSVVRSGHGSGTIDQEWGGIDPPTSVRANNNNKSARSSRIGGVDTAKWAASRRSNLTC